MSEEEDRFFQETGFKIGQTIEYKYGRMVIEALCFREDGKFTKAWVHFVLADGSLSKLTYQLWDMESFRVVGDV